MALAIRTLALALLLVVSTAPGWALSLHYAGAAAADGTVMPSSITAVDLSGAVWFRVDDENENAPLIQQASNGDSGTPTIGWWVFYSGDGASDHFTLSFNNDDFDSDTITTLSTTSWWCFAFSFDDSADTLLMYLKEGSTGTFSDISNENPTASITNGSYDVLIGDWDNPYVAPSGTGLDGHIAMALADPSVKTEYQLRAACSGDISGSGPWEVDHVVDRDWATDPDTYAREIIKDWNVFSSSQEISGPWPSTSPVRFARAWDDTANVILLRNGSLDRAVGISGGGAASYLEYQTPDIIATMIYSSVPSTAENSSINFSLKNATSAATGGVDSDFYNCEFVNSLTGGADNVEIYRFDDFNGSTGFTQLVAGSAFGDFSDGDRLTAMKVGPCIQCLVNGTVQAGPYCDDTTYEDVAGFVYFFCANTSRCEGFRVKGFLGYRGVLGNMDTIDTGATISAESAPFAIAPR